LSWVGGDDGEEDAEELSEIPLSNYGDEDSPGVVVVVVVAWRAEKVG